MLNEYGASIQEGPFVGNRNEMLLSSDKFEASRKFLYMLLNNIENHFLSENSTQSKIIL